MASYSQYPFISIYKNYTIAIVKQSSGFTADNTTTQEWIDKENNIKIVFINFPQYLFVCNITELKFSIQSLNTIHNLKDLTANVAIINNLTANLAKSPNVNNSDFSIFKNIKTQNGNFSIKYGFQQAGIHQIIVRITSRANNNYFSTLASFYPVAAIKVKDGFIF